MLCRRAVQAYCAGVLCRRAVQACCAGVRVRRLCARREAAGRGAPILPMTSSRNADTSFSFSSSALISASSSVFFVNISSGGFSFFFMNSPMAFFVRLSALLARSSLPRAV